MTEELDNARCGLPYALFNGKALQSTYDPGQEAERFVAKLSLTPNTQIGIVFAPALDYLSPALAARYPQLKILIIQCSAFFKAFSAATWPCWTPEPGDSNLANQSAVLSASLRQFFDFHLPSLSADAIRLIIWQPAVQVYGDRALTILTLVKNLLKERFFSQNTLHYFGRRWFRNVVNALSYYQEPARLKKGASPLLLIGAGPSLNHNIKLIHQAKTAGTYLLVVSSAFEALIEHGIQPDAVVTSDGGYWAKYHLTGLTASQSLLLCPLTAIQLSQNYKLEWIGFTDLSLWQNLLTRRLGFHFESLPQRGTVAATALDIGLSMTDGPIYLTAFDFEQTDILSHAQPNSHNRLFELSAGRFLPAYSSYFSRSLALAEADSLKIYRNWMTEKLQTLGSRCYYLGEANWLPPTILKCRSVTPNHRELPTVTQNQTDLAFFKLSKRNKPVIDCLQTLLTEELAASNSSFPLHAELLELLEPEQFEQLKQNFQPSDSEVPGKFIKTTNQLLMTQLTNYQPNND